MLVYFKFALVVTLFANTLGAHPTKFIFQVKEDVLSPHGWTMHSQPSPSHSITLRLGLPQPNFHVLEEHLFQVSDPDDKRYGQHLSKEEVEALVAPHNESLTVVNEWLTSLGFTDDQLHQSPAGDWVALTAPLDTVEEMLNTVGFSSMKALSSSDEYNLDLPCLETYQQR